MFKLKKVVDNHPLPFHLLLISFFLAGFLLSIVNFAKSVTTLEADKSDLESVLRQTRQELEALKNEDQRLANQKLTEEIKNIHDTFLKSANVYEMLIDLRAVGAKTSKLDEQFASALKLLSERNFASASAVLTKLESQAKVEKEKASQLGSIPANLPMNNAPPAGGYSRQLVQTDGGNFVVDVVSAELSTTKVIVDTASDSDCSDNCPVLALADFVGRNGAYAGVNGSYFCPSTYPDCINKKNSFDTLLMNKNKKYFNSDNNVYSTVPAVIFLGGSVRFVSQSLEWGRGTGIDGMIANFPLLVFNNEIVFGGDGVAKHNNRGGRSFVGASGNKIYIGVVRAATVLEAAKVLRAMGITNALNLDDGGSTALWLGGYKVGPGRNIPNAILFVRK